MDFVGFPKAMGKREQLELHKAVLEVAAPGHKGTCSRPHWLGVVQLRYLKDGRNPPFLFQQSQCARHHPTAFSLTRQNLPALATSAG